MITDYKSKAPLRITLVGQTFSEARTAQRAAAMRSLGYEVSCIPTAPEGANYETPPSILKRVRYRLRFPGDPAKANQAILREIENGTNVLWLDAADMIKPSSLRQVKESRRNISLIWYSEDDMMNPRLRTRQVDGTIPLFDLWVTTKSFNALPEELPALGAKNVFFVNNSCDPTLHRPVKISEKEQIQFGAPISFIGSFEEPRAQSLLYIAKRGMKVRIWGNGWSDWIGRHPNLKIENQPVYNDNFSKVVAASTINLCFLRKSNRDLQTCRSVEIPACAGFMLHERNNEIVNLYRDEREAIYFSTDEELSTLCSSWMKRDKKRTDIGRAARKRTLELGLTHESNISRIINALLSMNPDMSS